jgi:hypothetical protein
VAHVKIIGNSRGPVLIQGRGPTKFDALIAQPRQQLVEFLETEIQLVFTFAEMAATGTGSISNMPKAMSGKPSIPFGTF